MESFKEVPLPLLLAANGDDDDVFPVLDGLLLIVPCAVFELIQLCLPFTSPSSPSLPFPLLSYLWGALGALTWALAKTLTSELL